MLKRIELEKTDALKELTIRQVHERKFDLKQVRNRIDESKARQSEI